MFQVEEYVNYSSQGICQIIAIESRKFGPGSEIRPYYILKPIRPNSSDIFVPVDNSALVARMRPVLTPQEVDAAIAAAENVEMIWEPDRKKRTAIFQDILSRREEAELLALAACLSQRQKENAKGFASSELQTLRKVIQIICEEFAFSLNMEPRLINGYIRETFSAYPEN